MLDTIAINLQRDDFIIHEPDRFSPSAVFLNNPMYQGKTIMKAHYNPTKKEKAQGYLPRLTLYKKPHGLYSESVWLKVEFSASKLIFGNNFEELHGRDDFDTLLTALHAALAKMKVETDIETLQTAKIRAIHYSKNILLERSTPCFLLLQVLEKLDLLAKLDLNKSGFRNGGQSVQYHANSYEIALYDKVKDLEQARKYGEKRGIETDYDDIPDLFTDQRKPEVLRFEVRLTSKKIRSLFKTLGFKQDCTLDALFDASLSRAVLLHFWKTITNGLYMMNIDTQDIERLIYAARAAFPKKRPGTIMGLIGFIVTCQKLGVRGARLALGLKNHQWYRLKADAKLLENSATCPDF